MIHELAAQINVDDPSAVRIGYESSIPHGRYGKAIEVANVVLFLCSVLSSNVTCGQ